MIAAIIGLSILAFLAVIIGTAVHLDAKAFSTGVWPVIYTLPEIGLPIGFVLIIVLLILSTRRRARETKAAEAAEITTRAKTPPSNRTNRKK